MLEVVGATEVVECVVCVLEDEDEATIEERSSGLAEEAVNAAGFEMEEGALELIDRDELTTLETEITEETEAEP